MNKIFNYHMKTDKNYWLVGLLAALFFLPRLGNAHLFDWDEINFAECAREMLITQDYLRPKINFEPFWEKPPLFIWLQAISMHIFGVNEYAARFPNAICGIITLVLIYHIGKKLYNKNFGWFWVLSYFGAILPHLYFKSGIIDPWFNLFIFLSIVYLIKTEGIENQTKQYPLSILVGGMFAGLAILTKGPAGYLIISLTWFFKLIYFKEMNFFRIKQYFIFSIMALLTAATWFGVELIKNGTWFINEFITYNIRLAKTEDAGHGGFVGYHFVVILFGCFPASIFALKTLLNKYNFLNEKINFTRWMKVLFWVVIILFSIVQSKIVHYSSMCYLPLTFMSAVALQGILEKNTFYSSIKIPTIVLGILIGALVTAVPFLGQHIDILKPLFQKDLFALNNLKADVKWSWLEALAGLFLIIGIVVFPIFLKFRGILRGSLYPFFITAIFVQLTLYFFINNIEAYSQRAALDFYESKANDDVYILTYGFKSYAHFFYAKKRLPQNPNHSKDTFLLTGAIDKPTYVVGKITAKNDLDALPLLQFLYEKNGFVFYTRK